jgi:hypothetical protein
MSVCEQLGCEGHLGKFDSCVDETLYEFALDEMMGTGDTDWHGYFTLVIVPGPEHSTLEWIAGGNEVTVPAGNYIVVTWTSGAVSVWTYDTEALAREAWDAIDADYNLEIDDAAP